MAAIAGREGVATEHDNFMGAAMGAVVNHLVELSKTAMPVSNRYRVKLDSCSRAGIRFVGLVACWYYIH
jgi:hypothetical protein